MIIEILQHSSQPDRLNFKIAHLPNLALLNRSLKHRFYPHPSPLPDGEGTGVLAPFSIREKGWRGLAPPREEGISSLHSATPPILHRFLGGRHQLWGALSSALYREPETASTWTRSPDLTTSAGLRVAEKPLRCNVLHVADK